MSNQSRKIDLGTHALRVSEQGAGAQRIVCLHGFLDDTTVWDGIAPRLAELGRVVLVQQRAHGDSTAPAGPCSLEDLGADVLHLLDALEIARPVLVGHALGGLVALHAALAAPDRVAALALLSTEPGEREVARWRQVVRAGEVNKLQGLARSVFGPTSSRNVDGDGAALTEIARALAELGAHPLTRRLAEVRCPTVVIAGARDAAGVVAARAMAAAIPGAALEVIPEQGDAPHVGDPAAVASAIGALLARLPQG